LWCSKTKHWQTFHVVHSLQELNKKKRPKIVDLNEQSQSGNAISYFAIDNLSVIRMETIFVETFYLLEHQSLEKFCEEKNLASATNHVSPNKGLDD
jgi:hypothetical protein